MPAAASSISSTRTATPPEIVYHTTEQVTVAKLDYQATAALEPDDVAMLKVDVQGFEHEVLAGATAVLTRAPLVLLEVSFVPLYAGSPAVDETLALMKENGYVLARMDPCSTHPSGRVLAADAAFVPDD